MEILGYDHVGLRVSDRTTALRFFSHLGFVEDPQFTTERVAEIITNAGVRMNLIFNGQRPPKGANVLMDMPERWPGYTHAAFVVDSMQSVLTWAKAHGVAITEGPVDWGRRITCFLRDPDGNVLEFNELVPGDGN